MELTCSNCRKKAPSTATYCRDCYTVFPFEVRASALKGRERHSALGAWKWLPVLAIIAGGIWFYRADLTGQEEPEQAAEKGLSLANAHAPPKNAQEQASEESWSSLKKIQTAPRAPRRSAGGGGTISTPDFPDFDMSFAFQPRRFVPSVLASDGELACPSIEPCPAIMKFSPQDLGNYAITRWEGNLNTVIPADEKASILLDHNMRAILDMKLPDGKIRSVDLEKKASRWVFKGADGL